MAANSKETRRRKIMERGSDRLALITGRIETLPPPPASSPSSHSQPFDADANSSSQPLITDDQAIQSHISDPNTSVSPQGEAEESDPILLKHDPVTDPYHSNAYNSSSQTPPLHKIERENEISSVPTSEIEQVQPPQDSSVVISGAEQQSQLQAQDPKFFTLGEIGSAITASNTSGTEQQSQLQAQDPKFFTPGEISSAITASKSTRLCCSIAVALLVVLSYLGFPLLGSKFVKSIISFRPLYLVLVTNVTVVVAQLLSGKQRGSERAAGRQNRTSTDGDHWAEHLGRTLEAGMVMRNVMDAMFMDCASYAIIVICGLSLVQIFSK